MAKKTRQYTPLQNAGMVIVSICMLGALGYQVKTQFFTPSTQSKHNLQLQKIDMAPENTQDQTVHSATITDPTQYISNLEVRNIEIGINSEEALKRVKLSEDLSVSRVELELIETQLKIAKVRSEKKKLLNENTTKDISLDFKDLISGSFPRTDIQQSSSPTPLAAVNDPLFRKITIRSLVFKDKLSSALISLNETGELIRVKEGMKLGPILVKEIKSNGVTVIEHGKEQFISISSTLPELASSTDPKDSGDLPLKDFL